MKWNEPRQVEVSRKISPMGSGSIRRSDVYFSGTWDVDRAVKEALDRVTWVFRCVDAIASNQAKLPMYLREGNRYKGKFIDDHPLYKLFNVKSNLGENSVVFRYRLSGQLLLSRKGVFINVVRTNGGDVLDLILLPPDQIEIVPDRKKFIKEFKHTFNADGRAVTKSYKPEDILWIRRPHPFNQYLGMTPLDSAGLAIETEWLAKLYNRNFLVNDGRPGGIVVVKGDLEESDAEELRARFNGGIGKAGRITVIASEQGADFVDTAVTPRDAQYQETRASSKEEILMAFGVPESVLSNAAGKSFDNAEQERLIFWHETMKSHLSFIASGFDDLDSNENLFTDFDTSIVDVLQRAEMKRREYTMREFDGGLISANEYREDTGKDLMPGIEGDVMFVPKTKFAYATTTGEDVPQGLRLIPPTAGRPNSTGVQDQNPDPRVQEGDQRLAPLDNTPNAAPATQSSASASTDEVQVKSESIEAEPKVDYTAEAELAEAAMKAADRWEFILKREIERKADKIGIVLSEKISGPKFKKAFWDDNEPLEKLFDGSVWVRQFSEDLLGVQKSAYNEGYASVTGEVKTDFSMTALASHHTRTVVEEFRKAAENVVIDLKSHQDFRLATSEIKEKMKQAADEMPNAPLHALASEAYNRGVVDGCVKSGLRKMWWGDGDDLHLKVVEADELFISGKTSYKFPPAHMTNSTIVPVKEN